MNTSATTQFHAIVDTLSELAAKGDIDQLKELFQMIDHIDNAITKAITGLHACGYSWSEIAAPLGLTKQAAHKRWGGTPRQRWGRPWNGQTSAVKPPSRRRTQPKLSSIHIEKERTA